MSNPIFDKLDAALTSFQTKRTQEAATAAEKQDRKREFEAAYRNIATNLISPALQEVASHLKTQGYQATVEETADHTLTLKLFHLERAQSAILAYGARASTSPASFQIQPNSTSMTVECHGIVVRPGIATSETHGARGKFSLGDLTVSKIQELAINCLMESLK